MPTRLKQLRAQHVSLQHPRRNTRDIYGILYLLTLLIAGAHKSYTGLKDLNSELFLLVQKQEGGEKEEEPESIFSRMLSCCRQNSDLWEGQVCRKRSGKWCACIANEWLRENGCTGSSQVLNATETMETFQLLVYKVSIDLCAVETGGHKLCS